MSTRTVQLGDILKVDRTAASEDECARLPYVGLEHVEKDVGNFTSDFRRQPEALLATKFRFTPRHVLYGKLRPYLNKVVLPDFDGVCTTEILPLLPDESKLARGYLFALLLSSGFVSWATQRVSGANLPRLDPGLLEEFEITLPSLSEQRRIAGVLEQADRLRRTRRYALELSDSFLPAAFRQLFGDPLSATRRFPVCELGEVTKFIDYRGIAPNKVERGVRLVTARNVKRGTFDIEPQEFIPTEEYESWMTRGMPKPGDVLFTTEGHTLGSAAQLPVFEKIALAQRLIALQPREKLGSEFLLHLILSGWFQSEVGKRSTGSAARGISSKQLGEIPIPLPPLALQQQFASLVARHERLRAVQREALRQAEHLFQSLLHRAFTK